MNIHLRERESARKVITRLGGFAIEEKVTERTTHVVSGEPRRTLNILYGLSYGCWIVSLKWVDYKIKPSNLSDWVLNFILKLQLITSAEVESWVAEEQYEMLDEFPAASVSKEHLNPIKPFLLMSPLEAQRSERKKSAKVTILINRMHLYIRQVQSSCERFETFDRVERRNGGDNTTKSKPFCSISVCDEVGIFKRSNAPYAK